MKRGDETFAVRLPPDMARYVETVHLSLQAKAPFTDVTMSDALRHIIGEKSAAPTVAREPSYVAN